MYAVGICNPARRIADWSSLLLGTYPLVRKGPRPEVGTSLTFLAIGSGDMGYSGYKVRNSANDCPVPVPISFALHAALPHGELSRRIKAFRSRK